MKKLILSLTILIAIITYFVPAQSNIHTVSVDQIEEVNIGTAAIEIADQVEKVSYNNENTLALINDTNIKTVEVKETTNLFGKSSYKVVSLK